MGLPADVRRGALVAEAADHRQLMRAAIERDGEGQRALLGDDQRAARNAFAAASELYRQSWEAAPPASYGRLVGMLKAAVLAGSGEPQANYVRTALAGEQESSPTASYAVAVAALIAGDDVEARKRAEGMRAGADAYLLKDGPSRHFLDAISFVRDGGVYVSPMLRGAGLFRSCMTKGASRSTPRP